MNGPASCSMSKNSPLLSPAFEPCHDLPPWHTTIQLGEVARQAAKRIVQVRLLTRLKRRASESYFSFSSLSSSCATQTLPLAEGQHLPSHHRPALSPCLRRRPSCLGRFLI